MAECYAGIDYAAGKDHAQLRNAADQLLKIPEIWLPCPLRQAANYPAKEVQHGLALSFEAKAALALSVSRNAKVGNPIARMPRHLPGAESYASVTAVAGW